MIWRFPAPCHRAVPFGRIIAQTGMIVVPVEGLEPPTP